MGRLDGRVAFITGAARGQGRSHALRLADEGADVLAVDLCADLPTVPYPLGTKEELAETADLVRARGRRVLARTADVRDQAALRAVVADGIAELGGIDIVLANAGIAPFTPPENDPVQIFRDVVDINLIGVWNTIESVKKPMMEQDRGGSVVVTNSTAGLRANGTMLTGGQAYIAAKHALVGLVRGYAAQLGEYGIRVNGVHPTTVDTPMVRNAAMARFVDEQSYQGMHLLAVGSLDPVEISNAVLWLVSDEARYVTGVSLPVDAGFTAR